MGASPSSPARGALALAVAVNGCGGHRDRHLRCLAKTMQQKRSFVPPFPWPACVLAAIPHNVRPFSNLRAKLNEACWSNAFTAASHPKSSSKALSSLAVGRRESCLEHCEVEKTASGQPSPSFLSREMTCNILDVRTKGYDILRYKLRSIATQHTTHDTMYHDTTAINTRTLRPCYNGP